MFKLTIIFAIAFYCISCNVEQELASAEDLNDASLQASRWQGWIRLNNCTAIGDVSEDEPCPASIRKAEDWYFPQVKHNMELVVNADKTTDISVKLPYSINIIQTYQITLASYTLDTNNYVHKGNPIHILNFSVPSEGITSDEGNNLLTLKKLRLEQEVNSLNGVFVSTILGEEEEFFYQILLKSFPL